MEKTMKLHIQGRVDPRWLAIAFAALKDRGIKARTKSDLLDSALQLLAEIVQELDEIPVPEPDSAIAFLSRNGIGWTDGTRGARQVRRLLEENDRIKERIDLPPSERPKPTPELMQNILENAEQMGLKVDWEEKKIVHEPSSNDDSASSDPEGSPAASDAFVEATAKKEKKVLPSSGGAIAGPRPQP